MQTSRPTPSLPLVTALAVSAALGACGGGDGEGGTTVTAQSVPVTLGAEAEVPAPAVEAPDAAGTGTLTVGTNGEASGSITVSGLSGEVTAAHIHRGFVGSAGPVVVGLEPGAAGTDAGTTLTIPAGYAFDGVDLDAFRRGELYFNVHTSANPRGEVRGQIVPDGTTTFTVRIANVSTGATLNVAGEDGSSGTVAVPLSPGAFVVHRDENDSPLLMPRDAANAGLESVAEDGDPGPYVTGDDTVAGATVFDTPAGAETPGPAGPGDAYELVFTAVPGDKLGFVTMFVQSNDWFYTPTDDENSIALFGEDGTAISGDVTDQVDLWDAGTEEDGTPGAGENQVSRQAAPNTGDPDDDTTVGSLEGRGQTVDIVDGESVIGVTVAPAAP